ncbi:MAG: hypothetical protein HY360_11915 [Verrucomicrobia bacterium]|nr:hypothetical protein [Verrucomicrobiota bacterium]
MRKSVLTMLLVLSLAIPLVRAASRETQWKKVDEALQKGLPKTAIEELESILKETMTDKAYAEWIKALARKIVLEANIQGNHPEEKIRRLEAALAQAPAATKPILNVILAHWYWHYFQTNRWRFMQRTATAQPPGDDFTAWDLPRLFAEIDRKFAAALADADQLQKIPIAAYDDLLEKGAVPDAWRPTLYDFLANEALQFYTSGEQAAAKPLDSFEVAAESDMLASAEKFIPWKPETTDADSPVLKAIRLYQDLLRFHQKDKDHGAYLDADIARLVYAKNIVFGDQKNPRFKAAMETLANNRANHDLASMALYHWALTVHQEGNFVEARALAARGEKTHPSSDGGHLCHNLIAQIEAKSAAITTERVWNKPIPMIQVRYRNVTSVYFRAVAMDWSIFLDRRHNRPESLSDEDRRMILKKPPALEWSHKLAPNPDYKENVAEFPAPENLKPGFYFILASHNPAFGEDDNVISMADVWVSNLALITRTQDGQLEGFVLDAESGELVEGATVEGWYLDNRNGSRVAIPHATTDQEGFFSFGKLQINRGYLLRASHRAQEVAMSEDNNLYRLEIEGLHQQTLFFTDRTIYRPGQTIQYKGICASVDHVTNDYKVLASQAVTVIFSDPNNKEIARQERQANDYGSFSGSFTAPRDRLMGWMNLRVQGAPPGYAAVRVEEYKRPKFQVTLDAPKTAAKLNKRVTLQGRALAYSGAAVDGAQVRYRIVRDVRMPWWWDWFCWRFAPIQTGRQEIAHETLKTETDGSFKIEFVAKPDPSISEKGEPIFAYQVNADVTDSAGETRSANRLICVGYTAIQAIMTANDWQTDEEPVAIELKTQTLDGEPQKAEGSIKIHALDAPARVQRSPLIPPFYRANDYEDPSEIRNPQSAIRNGNDPNTWSLGKVIAEQGFTTDNEGKAVLKFKLPMGAFRAVLETQDRLGKKVTGLLPLRILRPADKKFAIKIPHLVTAPEWSVEPGQEFKALWGTGYDEGRAFVEIEHRHKMVQRFWTKPGRTQEMIGLAVTEAMRGGFTLHVTQVRENRAYLDSRSIDVPWSNKQFDVKWEHFTSKLQPNQKETWTAVVTGKDAPKAVAEMVAALYDESLDAFLPHRWIHEFGIFRHDYSSLQAVFSNIEKPFRHSFGLWNDRNVFVDVYYRRFPRDIVEVPPSCGLLQRVRQFHSTGIVEASYGESETLLDVNPSAAAVAVNGNFSFNGSRAVLNSLARNEYLALGRIQVSARESSAQLGPASDAIRPKGPDLSQVTARKNLQETAFFFPHLMSDSNGVVRIEFTMPEALTQWKFFGFAHDQECRSGFLEGKAVTSKDLMVQPNPPRFLREGDVLEFTVKVSNLTDQRQKGKVRLTLNDARTDQPADKFLGNTAPEQSFDIPPKESRGFSWRLRTPDNLTMLSYKAVAASDRVSDGEEGIFPVLSRRIFVTESLPLPIRGPAEKKFNFKRLQDAGKSDTLRHQGLTVQMVSNPSWYAVMALPYLMEFPHECAEQIFNRLYANALARTIAQSDPKIRRIFDQWKGTPALDSPLEKNQDLKSLMLEETPWHRQAQSESQARRDVGILFDDNRLEDETARTLKKLSEMQNENGMWPWFPGGRGNEYITLYITTGFGRLRHLGVNLSMDPAVRSLDRLDRWLDKIYREILKDGHKEDNHLDPTVAFYLYGRSFFLKDKPIAGESREAVDYFLGQARTYWVELANRQSQGHLALALLRFGDAATPRDIMKSIRERSVSDEEMGLFWRDTELSWWWYRAPIETQAVMIEAFDEVMNDAKAVEDCKVWLLKQKQTQDWKTTKATADAVYALLLRGEKNLASDALVEVALGGKKIEPEKVEAGTGFYEKRFTGPEVAPALADIVVKKTDPGVAWGSVHWQYLEDMTKVTPYAGTPVKLKKTLFIKKPTRKGLTLEPVKGAFNVGDELAVRIELRADRDMEYVHMKDQRGSGLEPLNVLSGYRYQDGLAYYESTRDTASHFFIDYLPKGVYVFEYGARAVHRGDYQSGIAGIECMYAPEFNSHSESFGLQAR